jgi:hypothetical protein
MIPEGYNHDCEDGRLAEEAYRDDSGQNRKVFGKHQHHQIANSSLLDDAKFLSDVQGQKTDDVFIGSCMTNMPNKASCVMFFVMWRQLLSCSQFCLLQEAHVEKLEQTNKIAHFIQAAL